MADRPPRLAVLIDADNTSPKVADGLFDEIAKIGEAGRSVGHRRAPRAVAAKLGRAAAGGKARRGPLWCLSAAGRGARRWRSRRG